MRTHKKTFVPAAAGMQAALKSSELLTALRPHMAKARWAEIVGPQVAGVTQVEKVQGTELVVRVKNSVWANELVLLKGDMLRRLNGALGGAVLTDIRFKASGLAKEKERSQSLKPPLAPTGDELARVMLTPQAIARVEKAAQKVTDEALRERVRRSLLRAARVETWKRGQGWRPCGRCGTLTLPSPDNEWCELCRVEPSNSTAARPVKDSAS